MKKSATIKVQEELICDALELIMPDKNVIMDQVETLFEEEKFKVPSWKVVRKAIKSKLNKY